MSKFGKSSLQPLEHKFLVSQDQHCLGMTTKNESLRSDTFHDGIQSSSQSSVSNSATDGRIEQTLLASSAARRPARTRDTTSCIHKRPRLEISNGNDEGRSMEGEEVKVQMSLTRMPVDDNTKLYSKPPMENPEDERRRRNAIIAWKNRVWKKRQYEELQTMVNTLEETNKKLNDANHRMEEDLRAQRQKLDLENSIVTQLKADKSSLETLIQNQQENLAFIREHLMLINRCSEEDSPVRKFLTALLNTMNSSSPISFTPTLLPVASLSHHSSDIPTVPPPTTSPPCSTYPRLTTSSLHVSMLPKEASLMPSLVPIPKSTVASQHFPRNRVGSPPHEV